MSVRDLLVSVAVVMTLGPAVRAADYPRLIEKGNDAYQAGKYDQALEAYRTAEAELKDSPNLHYNIGGALHQAGQIDEAIEQLKLATLAENKNVAERANYNLGNSFYRKQDFQNAIESYKRALDLDPGDMDAKFNLEVVQRLMENQQQQQQDDEQQDEQQDQQDQQDQKDQQDQQQEDQNQQDQQDQQQDQQNQEDQQQQQQQQPQQMSREDAERILNALKDDEQDIQKKIKRQTAVSVYQGKDW